MPERKTTKNYIFTVEGDTEKWYLDWLQHQINSCAESKYNVKITPIVEKNPLSYAKRKSRLTVPELYHIADVESKSEEHRKNFDNLLCELSKIKKEKSIICNLGYSNFAFELWIILHKKLFKTPLTDRTKYLTHINNLYDKSFLTLDNYKESENFKSCLKELDLDCVKFAIINAKKLYTYNEEIKNKKISNYGYTFFDDDPSTSVHIMIEKILKDCKLI